MMKALLLRMFGRREGVLGRLGGLIMAHMNRAFAHTLIDAMPLRAHSRVLEIGFGPGVAIERLTEFVPSGLIAGVDPSRDML